MIHAEKVILVSGRITMSAFGKITMLSIKPIHLGTTEEKMVEHMKENPMPIDEKYSEEDFIYDITKTSGFYSLPDGSKEETIEYVINALNKLV